MLEDGILVRSAEADIISGSKYINVICEHLRSKFSDIVTKEELMNYYLHEMKASGRMDTSVTTLNLVQAANLVGVKVKGQSKLEVNVPIMEQWRYIRETKASFRKISLKERLENNKEDIIRAYERGITTEDIANSWHCSMGTINTYLKKWGAKIRKRGRVKIGDGILRETGADRKRRGKRHA